MCLATETSNLHSMFRHDDKIFKCLSLHGRPFASDRASNEDDCKWDCKSIINFGGYFSLCYTRMWCYDEMLSILSFTLSTHLQADWQTAHQIGCHFSWAFSRHRHDCPFCDSMRSSSKKMRHSFSPNDVASKLYELINVNQFFSSTVCACFNWYTQSETNWAQRWCWIVDTLLITAMMSLRFFYILSAQFPARFTLR